MRKDSLPPPPPGRLSSPGSLSSRALADGAGGKDENVFRVQTSDPSVGPRWLRCLSGEVESKGGGGPPDEEEEVSARARATRDPTRVNTHTHTHTHANKRNTKY